MVWFWLVAALAGAPPAVQGLLDGYAAQGASAPDASRGEALWKEQRMIEGEARACTSCHGDSLAAQGRHATTGEPIEPMTAAGRLQDPAKIEKWFGRNCRWTLGRECTPAERADVLVYLTGGVR